MKRCGIPKKPACGYGEALGRARAAIAKEGFGIPAGKEVF